MGLVLDLKADWQNCPGVRLFFLFPRVKAIFAGDAFLECGDS